MKTGPGGRTSANSFLLVWSSNLITRTSHNPARSSTSLTHALFVLGTGQGGGRGSGDGAVVTAARGHRRRSRPRSLKALRTQAQATFQGTCAFSPSSGLQGTSEPGGRVAS